jgi:hypothetical protein
MGMGRRAKRTAPKFYFVVMIFQGEEEEGGGGGHLFH